MPESTALPSERAAPGDYRPESTPRRWQSRAYAARADDRAELEHMDSDEARTFARENRDAGAEDYDRWRARGSDYRSPAEARRARRIRSRE